MEPNETTNNPQLPPLPERKYGATGFSKSLRGGWLPVVNHPGRGIGVLFGAFFIMMLILSAVIFAITLNNGTSPKLVRIMTVLQDILVFIAPAILAAFIATRLPASLLTVNVKPRLSITLLALLAMITSMPAMEWIIELNYNIHLPESMSGLEQTLRSMEESASDTISSMMGGTSAGDLIMGILIVGVLAGISEELFFRGALQNLFMSMRKVNKHFAIWAAAFIFSLMHFQFFGFVPRLLLGAYFGYLIWWSGSVWVPIIAHAFNNTLVVVTSWIGERNGIAADVEDMASINIATDWRTIVLSIAVTAFGIYIIRRQAQKS